MLSDQELEALVRRSAPRELPPVLQRSLTRLTNPHASPILAWAGASMIALSIAALVLVGWFERH